MFEHNIELDYYFFCWHREYSLTLLGMIMNITLYQQESTYPKISEAQNTPQNIKKLSEAENPIKIFTLGQENLCMKFYRHKK